MYQSCISKDYENVIEELEKIKEEMDKDRAILFDEPQKVEVLDEWIKILDKRISDLYEAGKVMTAYPN